MRNTWADRIFVSDPRQVSFSLSRSLACRPPCDACDARDERKQRDRTLSGYGCPTSAHEADLRARALYALYTLARRYFRQPGDKSFFFTVAHVFSRSVSSAHAREIFARNGFLKPTQHPS